MKDDNASLTRYGIKNGSTIMLMGTVSLLYILFFRI